MFKDYPHKNKIIKNNPDFIVKSLSSEEILLKEFYVLDFLSKRSFTPSVYNLNKNYFLEQRLFGREIGKNDLTNKNIKKLAIILKQIHNLSISPDVKKYLQNKFLAGDKYRPVLITRTILKKFPKKLLGDYERKVLNIAKAVELKLQETKYNISLIHGDLSYHNIFMVGDDIFLIDWTDCRLDIPSCDVSQLFYLLDFNNQQERLFLKYYKSGYIDDQLLIFHKILLLLYDLASIILKKKSIEASRLDKMLVLCDKFYGQ